MKNLRTKMTWYVIQVYFPLFVNVPRNKMGTFFNVLSEQNITEHFFGVERSVLTEHLDTVFPRTLRTTHLLPWHHRSFYRNYKEFKVNSIISF